MMSRCPNHQLPKSQLVQYFYEGLLPYYQRTINAAANGSILDLTLQGAWDLFEKTATNDQQYGTRDRQCVREVTSSSSNDTLKQFMEKIDRRLEKLECERVPRQCNVMGTSQALVAPSCDYCGSPMHISNICPSRYKKVSTMFQGRPMNQKWNPYSNTYNDRWRQNPNFSWRDNDNRGLKQFQEGTSGLGASSSHFQEPSRMVIPLQNNSLSQPKSDETNQLLKSMATQLSNMDNQLKEDKALNDSQFSSIATILQRRQGDNATICKKLEELELKNNTVTSHLTQVANTMSDLQARGGGIPSNTVINPKALNAITLRSERTVHFTKEDEEDVEEEMETEPAPHSTTPSKKSESSKERALLVNMKEPTEGQEEEKNHTEVVLDNKCTTLEHDESSQQGTILHKGKEVKVSDIPFPQSFLNSQKKMHNEQHENELIEMFSKLEVNIPLLQLIKKVP
ncbi:uncharacterized protein LOC114715138 [Neltuma alba]|uniref:uncharacterized protein LOC114715138 n=1 Tax=Neltuma alba TaxID=207710 RepID=UPI0010A2C3F0|nr:uncharacterized protein LOC114715138 [Prosopis alba]